MFMSPELKKQYTLHRVIMVSMPSLIESLLQSTTFTQYMVTYVTAENAFQMTALSEPGIEIPPIPLYRRIDDSINKGIVHSLPHSSPLHHGV